jgi:hypothetical protein
MEVSFDELALVDDSIIHFEFSVAMIPSFFILSLILVLEPVGHLL